MKIKLTVKIGATILINLCSKWLFFVSHKIRIHPIFLIKLYSKDIVLKTLRFNCMIRVHENKFKIYRENLDFKCVRK